MKLRFTIAMAALLGTTSVFSAVTLNVAEEIKIVAVNDQEVSGGLFSKNENYKLDAGINKISVRYTDYFQHHDNSHDILKSGVVTVTTPGLQDGQTYRLGLINPPKDFDEAQEYKNQPVIGLYNSQNQLLVQQSGAVEVKKSLFGGAGGFLSKTLDLTTKSQTPVNQPPVLYQATVQQDQVKNDVNTVQGQLNISADQQMIQIWQKASKQERQKFMSWLATQ